MASRRVAVKAIDWVAFAERVPPNQKTMFNAFKNQSDAIAARLTSLPERPPAIDWDFYRKVIAKPGMVDEFEKKSKDAAAYVEDSKIRIIQYEKELKKFQNMIPFDQMTIEDLNEAFPETKLDKEKYPYWPHKPVSEL
ncbi:ATP synthase subunit d, mitochondrial isoform X2 [Rhinatrema bivittatum]|uniref:ATP synthase subunit d, mitochondrial isoform X2 n=1 Tax=Rhinatrema bivittatum TaxID=194408 RepID=UPI00112813CA|nr:ATP synthase subunit d, mitochondrial isoform X2 [Rhinatrema bivittatum]